MITLESIRESLPGYARDLQLNLGTVLSSVGAPDLNERQIWAVALASASASRNPDFTRALQTLAAQHLDAAHVNAAHAAAAIMAMNNVYYRFLHLVEDGFARAAAAPARADARGGAERGAHLRYGARRGARTGECRRRASRPGRRLTGKRA